LIINHKLNKISDQCQYFQNKYQYYGNTVFVRRISGGPPTGLLLLLPMPGLWMMND
jgi:hypothetical protein